MSLILISLELLVLLVRLVAVSRHVVLQSRIVTAQSRSVIGSHGLLDSQNGYLVVLRDPKGPKELRKWIIRVYILLILCLVRMYEGVHLGGCDQGPFTPIILERFHNTSYRVSRVLVTSLYLWW
jgi:hypothetical protein